eukprot:TRINITY_DN233_c1_g1_i3.p1 TRINITY_DN233_c1_g1~~TRINITY_DN233_c1_g1_i3.p1  ORF type:complete len:1129 (-),score=594.88 TRINITY_DN233_c1_g1_i3:46-3432(-)
MNRLKHKGDNKIKVEFTITFINVKGVPKSYNGQEFFIESKRGKKKENHTVSAKGTVKEDQITFEGAKTSITCTLFEDTKKKVFEPKKEVTFLLSRESIDKKKKEKSEPDAIAKGSLVLNSYAVAGSIKSDTVTLVAKDKAKITLGVRIETKWVKVNNKMLVKKNEGEASSNPVSRTPSNDVKSPSSRTSMMIEGENYSLQTADEITETDASVSDDEDGNSGFPDDEDDKVPPPPSAEPSTVNLDVNAIKLKYESEISDLKKDNQRLERKLSRMSEATSPKENSKDEVPPPPSPELEDMRKDKARLERKVERLQKELEEAKSGAPTSNGNSAENSGDISKLENRIRDLEKKLETETKEKLDFKDKYEKSVKKEKVLTEKSKEHVTDLKIAEKVQEEKTKQITQLQVELENLKKEHEEEKSSAASTGAASSEEMKVVQKTLEKEIKDKAELSRALETLRKERDQLKSQLEDTKTQSGSVDEEVAKLRESLKASKKETESAKKDAENHQQKISELQKKISELENNHSGKVKEISVLNAQLEEHKTKSSSSQKKSQEDQVENEKRNKQLQEDLDEAQAEVDSLKEKISKLEKKHTEKLESRDSEISGLKEQLVAATVVTVASKAASPKDDRSVQLEAQISKLKSQVEKSEQETKEKEEAIEELEAKNKKLAKKADKLESQVDELKAELKEAESKPDQDEDSTSELKEKISQLEEDLEKKSREVEEFESQVEKLNIQLEDAKKSGDQPVSLRSKKAADVQVEDSDEQLKAKIKADRQVKELESLKKKEKILQKELLELKLIENNIYNVETEFDDSQGVPTAVLSIKSALMTWSAFDPVNEDVLSSIITALRKTFMRSAYDSEMLAFWLSYVITLFNQLKTEVPNSEFDDSEFQDENLAESSENLPPISRFFHELLGVAFDVYSLLLINLFSKLDNILTNSILDSGKSIHETPGKRQTMTEFPIIMSETLQLLRKNFIPETIINKFLVQILYFMDAQLFNTLIKRTDLFTANQGFQIKMSISQVEKEISKIDKQLGSAAHKNLNFIKETANLFVMDKSIMADTDTAREIFTNLNVVQIRYILNKYKADDASPDPVSAATKRVWDDLCNRRENSGLPLEMDPVKINRSNLLAGSS